MKTVDYENYKENKIHSDSIFPYITYLCSIPLDFKEVMPHWHDDMEIIYIKKGQGSVSLDFTNHIVHAGDIVVVVPGQIHGIFQYEDYEMEYENIIFSPDMFISLHEDSLREEFFTPLLNGSLIFSHHITTENARYYNYAKCLDKADHICSFFPKGYKLMLKACLYQFFFEIVSDSIMDTHNKKSKNIDRLKTVLDYVEKNYSHPISIDEIAAISGFSESHFMKFFKNNMGVSFIDYLNDFRLSMASRLLASTDEKIIDLASACGYDNLSYFNRMFRRKYNLTPKEYRKASLEARSQTLEN